MSASELKRCPFCGGEGRIIIVQSVGICVICLNCQARTCGVNDEQSAIAAWNRRAGDEAHKREKAKLTNALEKIYRCVDNKRGVDVSSLVKSIVADALGMNVEGGAK